MRKTKVKICGITCYDDAVMALRAGADALGFNFIASSKRFISPDDAKAIISGIGDTVWHVGIFLNHPKTDVFSIAKYVGLNTLQFHGDESPDYCAEFSTYRIIKAFRVASFADASAAKQYENVSDYFLFDASVSGESGGTGQEIHNDILQGMKGHDCWTRTFLAGGLSPSNVAEKVTMLLPFGVDVASGVEISPGKKDPEKVRNFIISARLNCDLGTPEN